MGIVVGTLLVIGLVTIGSLITGLLEPKLTKPRATRGPAVEINARADVEILNTDRWLYPVAPFVALMGVGLAAVVLPLSPSLLGRDLGIGVFYFIVVVDYVVLGVALGGWGANTRSAVEAYYRIVAQLVAYVVPLGLAYIGAIMMARSLSTVEIVKAQSSVWYIVIQPIGFGLYVITGLMQAYRSPFREAFSEKIDFGIFASYGGWKIIMWRLALSGLLFVVAAMGAVLYLGGWQGPFLPGPVWMLVKTFGLMVFMLWVGNAVKPLSTSQMLALSWKVLTPLGLLNVLIVGGLILLGVSGR